jgi:hypothetical protein
MKQELLHSAHINPKKAQGAKFFNNSWPLHRKVRRESNKMYHPLSAAFAGRLWRKRELRPVPATKDPASVGCETCDSGLGTAGQNLEAERSEKDKKHGCFQYIQILKQSAL